MTNVNPVPDDYPGVSPYLIAKNPDALIDFYKAAFGAEERMRLAGPDGKLAHGEVRIGQATVMLSGEHPGMNCYAPAHYGGSPLTLCVFVPDVDALAARAEKAGAQIVQPLENKFYGDRAVTLKDPEGYTWSFMTHIEDVSPEELSARMAAMHG